MDKDPVLAIPVSCLRSVSSTCGRLTCSCGRGTGLTLPHRPGAWFETCRLDESPHPDADIPELI
jgi:hypothetical protein